MNYIKQKVEVSTEIEKDEIVFESDQGEKSNTNNKVLPFAILILLGLWVGLSAINEDYFLTEALLSSVIISILLLMKTIYDPKNLRRKTEF